MISLHQKYVLPKGSKVLYQGEIGAYSELAIVDNIENGIAIPKNTFEDVFKSIHENNTLYGMIPIENSIAGKVNGIYDLMKTYSPKIIFEVKIAIEHCLIVNPGIKKIKTVYSHIQALKQCHNYISNQMLFQIPYYDTAGAVKMIKDLKIMNAGAIASKLAAKIYDMDILDSNLGSKDNITTFNLIKSQN